jgi:hypothetical protein
LLFHLVLILFDVYFLATIPGQASALTDIMGIESKIIVVIVTFFLVILFKNKKLSIPQYPFFLFFIFYFFLTFPALFNGWIPVIFSVKWFAVLLVFYIGYNDFNLKPRVIKFVLIYMISAVVLKNVLFLDYPSPVHIFNTNEAILSLVVLSYLSRAHFLGLMGVILTGSRSGIISYFSLLFYSNRKIFLKIIVVTVTLFLVFSLIGQNLISKDIFTRFYLVLDDINCIVGECSSPSFRVQVFKEGVKDFGSVFGLTLEYMDHYQEIWIGRYIYDPHFGVITWLWGAGIYGLCCFVAFNYLMYQKYKKNYGYKIVFVVAFVITMFNDLSLSILPWYYLGYYARSRISIKGGIR